MTKWVVAVTGSLTLFIIVLLILGWVLKNNEQSTMTLIKQLSEEHVHLQHKKNVSYLSKKQDAIYNTCTDNRYCHLIEAPSDQKCLKVVNSKGLHQLKALSSLPPISHRCHELHQYYQSICINHQCIIQKLN